MTDLDFRIHDIAASLIHVAEQSEYLNGVFKQKTKQDFTAWQNHSRKMMDEFLKIAGESEILEAMVDAKHELTNSMKEQLGVK
jgi:hypothetical protein